MGEAKRRGGYEERKAAGEARVAQERARRKEEMAKREAAMTPEERASRRRLQSVLASVYGIALSAGVCGAVGRRWSDL